MDEFEFEETSPSVIHSIVHVFSTYGWYILTFFIIAYFVYRKSLKSYVEQYRQHRFEREYAAKYHKNPDIFVHHVNAQKAWADKMQEKYNNESEEQQRKMKEREERKKQELAQKYGKEGGHVLGGGGGDGDKGATNLRPDFNPLMGSGGSSGYRPPRRSPCGGGGCGR